MFETVGFLSDVDCSAGYEIGLGCCSAGASIRRLGERSRFAGTKLKVSRLDSDGAFLRSELP